MEQESGDGKTDQCSVSTMGRSLLLPLHWSARYTCQYQSHPEPSELVSRVGSGRGICYYSDEMVSEIPFEKTDRRESNAHCSTWHLKLSITFSYHQPSLITTVSS
jgi:hypothetical protein